MTAGQPHRQPQFDKFVMIFVTEKGVKTFRGNHNQSAASYSLKDDSSIIDKASGCMIRNSPCILLGKIIFVAFLQSFSKDKKWYQSGRHFVELSGRKLTFALAIA